MVDSTDVEILRLLQANGRTSNAELSRQLEMAPSAVLERVRKLEARGTIRGYACAVDPEAVGLGLTAFVFVRADERTGTCDTGRALAEIPEVQEVHNVAGEDCYLVKLRAADTSDLARVMRERFGPIATVRSTRTTIVLETLKETSTLVLPEPTEERGRGRAEDPHVA